MNKAYRTIWSEARQCFVVAHEKAAARGKPSSTRKAVAQAVFAALAALSAANAMAAGSCTTAGTSTISGATTTACSLDNTQHSVLVTNTGTLSVSGAPAVTMAGGITANGSISNAGTVYSGVSSTTSGAIQIGTSPPTNTKPVINFIRNTGLINAPSASGIVAEGFHIQSGITNGGTIIAGGDPSSDNGYGMRLTGYYFCPTFWCFTGVISRTSTLSGGILNTGLIQSAATAIYLDSVTMTSGGITNTGTITNSGSWGGGIALSDSTLTGNIVNGGLIASNWEGIDLHFSTISGHIINTGLIHADSSAIYMYHGSVGGGITNSSTIVAGSDAYAAIYIEASSVGGDVANSGTIVSGGQIGISIEDGSVITGVFTNSGTIQGVETGLYIVYSTLGGGLTNSGLIHNTGSYGAGLMITSSTVDGNIVNAAGGVISGGYSGLSIQYSTAINGDLINAGTIQGGSTGVLVTYSTITGSISNSGLIKGVDWYGLKITSEAQVGGITNSGTIEGARAGVYLRSSSILTGMLTNSGTIAASASGSYVTAQGVKIEDSSITGGLVNSGNITASASGGSSAYGYGIYLSSSTLTGGLTNSGTILGGGSTLGYGLYVSGSQIDGGLVNEGLIQGGYAGVRLNTSTLTGGLTNSGTIQGGYTGIYLSYSTLIGGLTNSGTIAGSDYAIYVDSSSSLDSIVIAGNDTAKFIGEVYAPATPVTVAGGAIYTLDSGNRFNVQSFSNQGTLRVAPGVATITGDFTTSGTFSPAVADSGYGRISVSGAVALGGTLAVDAAGLTAANTYNGTVAGVIYGGSSRTGTFATVTDNSLLFDFTPVYKTDGFDLTFGGSSPGGVLAAVNATGNSPARGAAAALDAIIADNPGGPIATLFLPFSTQQQVSDAVSQTLPVLTGGSQLVLHGVLSDINRVVQARQDANLGLSSGETFYGDRKFWMKPFGSWAEQDDRNRAPGYDARSGGLLFGADAVVSDATRLGISLAYARVDADGNARVAPQKLDVDVYQIVGYGSHALDEASEINFRLGVGRTQNDGVRRLPAFGLTAKSDYSSNVVMAGLGYGRTFEIGEKTRLTPSVRADYSWIRDESYREKGAGVLNLHVNRNTTEELILAVDGKLTHELSSGVNFTANLGVGYDVINERASVTSAFAGAPNVAFTTRGIDPSPWMVRGGLGISGSTQSGLEITARYDAEHREDYLNQTASVKFRWSF